MINLRYHIVSITAVFLALGIGLTLGSTFLDRVTVDTLKAQLDDVEAQVARTEQENAELRAQLEDLRARDEALEEALPERLLSGRLEGVPVLVIATRGTAPELREQAVRALAAAGADVAGTWWLTERWALDDEEETSELSELLDVATDDPDRLRRNAAIRLAALLDEAAAPAEDLPGIGGSDGGAAEPDGGEGAPTGEEAPTGGDAGADGGAPTDGDGTGTDATGTTGGDAPAAPSEPELVAALEEAGFVDYEAAPGAEGGVPLPAAGVRYVVLSSGADVAGPQAFAGALLDEISAEGPVPVLAAQGEVDLGGDDAPASADERRTTFVGPIRDGELTRERVSTIDHLDTPSGLAALVLALEDLAEPAIGHYGVAADAARLLPAPPEGA